MADVCIIVVQFNIVMHVCTTVIQFNVVVVIKVVDLALSTGRARRYSADDLSGHREIGNVAGGACRTHTVACLAREIGISTCQGH